MNTEIFHFKVGTFNCMAISDGTMTYAPPTFPPPAVFLFVNAPRERLAQTLEEQGLEVDKWQEWTSTYTCLFIDTGKQRILVDTGADGLGPNTGKLIPNLLSEGIGVEDIDLVILTHGHPDHLGGVTGLAGKPVFPKAQCVIGREEWNFWTSGSAGQHLAEHGRETLINIALKNLMPLKDRMRLIEDKEEIVPGIRALVTPGHTPGQVVLDISPPGERLLCLSDLVIHPIHLAYPEWYAATDVLPEKLVAARQQILQVQATRKERVMVFHFPFPGLGYILRKGKAWGWQPV